jgi:hypothetical protein
MFRLTRQLHGTVPFAVDFAILVHASGTMMGKSFPT